MADDRPTRPRRSDWTRGASGRFVDWSAPPYREGGTVTFLVDDERPEDVSSATMQRRILEYYRVLRRGATARSGRRRRAGQR